MAIALVRASAQSLGGSGGTTSAIDTSGADLIVVSISRTDGSTTPSDSASNTWTGLTKRADGAGATSNQLYYAWNATGSATHTFTVTTGAAQFVSIGILAFSGSLTSGDPFDLQSTANNGGGGGTTGQPGSITPSVDNCVVVAAVEVGAFSGAVTTLSVNSPFATRTWVDFVASTSYGVGVSYVVQTAAAAANPTWTAGASTFMALTQASFKPAAGGGGITVAQEVGIFDAQRTSSMTGLVYR